MEMVQSAGVHTRGTYVECDERVIYSCHTSVVSIYIYVQYTWEPGHQLFTYAYLLCVYICLYNVM